MIIYHPLQKDDLKFLVDLFNEQYIDDPITEEILDEKIFHEEHYDSDLNFTVKNHNTLVGFASGMIREQAGVMTGWIKLMATTDQKSMGTFLQQTFDKIESKLLEKGAKTIRFFDSFPNYFIPGIDPRCTSLITLLQKKGYERRRDNVTMTTSLTDLDLDTEKDELRLKKNHNIEIKRATGTDKLRVFHLVNKEFSLWSREITLAFQKEKNPLHIALSNQKVIAFSNHSCNNAGTGWFGPMGTTKEARGKGIGEILLKRCLADLKKDGHREAIIPWVGPIGFYYEKSRAEVSRVYWNFSKNFTA